MNIRRLRMLYSTGRSGYQPFSLDPNPDGVEGGGLNSLTIS